VSRVVEKLKPDQPDARPIVVIDAPFRQQAVRLQGLK